MDKNEYFKTWSEKLGISIADIELEFNNVFAEEQTIHPDLDSEQQTKRALQRVANIYKKQMKSPAIGFEGIIIGASDCVDVIAKKKREAIELYNTDPTTAISQGVTNEEGMPLDTKETWASGKLNPGFGKPLPENSFLRNIYGIAKKTSGEDTPRSFSIILNGEKAENTNIPIFEPVKFMAIDKSQGTETYTLNASTFTNFVVSEVELPATSELLTKHCEVVLMSNLGAYHTLNSADNNRIAIVEGDVSQLNLEPTAFGSRIMNIENPEASLEDLDAVGTTCWLPPHVKVDFAEGSKVLIVGRTEQGKKKDNDGNMTEELGDVTLSVLGVYAIPEYKVELPEDIKPVTEESLSVE